MPAIITFFPVDNGDMTLIRLADPNQTAILIDTNIRASADDDEDETRDVATDLRDRLRVDTHGRPYVDAFLLSHPDKDHCCGLERHFYLGPIDEYPDDDRPASERRIVIREIWSSPIVFRRASTNHILCSDAKAFQREAKRRVNNFRDSGGTSLRDGERVLILGEDEGGKTDDLSDILVPHDTQFSRVNGTENEYISSHLLGPLPRFEDDEEVLSKNHSSTMLNIRITAVPASINGCQLLTAGDAEVAIWERLWARHKEAPSTLEYDILQAPHHCSWHSLSHDSWSELGENATVSQDARSALSQARSGAFIVASSKPISDDDSNPPYVRAQREYRDILKGPGGIFLCTGEEPNTWAPAPLEFEVTSAGARRIGSRVTGAASLAAAAAPRAGFR